VVDSTGRQSHRAIGHVDSVEEIGSRVEGASSIGRGAYALVRGWVLHEERREPVDALRVSLDVEGVAAVLGFPRPDIVEHFGPASLNAGFVAAVPITAPNGEHRITIEARSSDGVLPCDASSVVRIGVPEHPLMGRQERSDSWAFAFDGICVSGGVAASYENGVAVVPLGTPANVRLWAIDLAERAPPARIVARSGGIYLRVIDGLKRDDAALSLGVAGAERCGFAVPVSPSLSGVELVELFAISVDGTYARLGDFRLRRPDALPFGTLPYSGQIRGSVDQITVNGVSVPASSDITVGHRDILTIRGWAVDEVGPRLCGGVFVEIEGGSAHEAPLGGVRNDVAAELGIVPREFVATIDTTSLSPGRRGLSLFALTARRDARGDFGQTIFVNVT
jgi:hypothetical protein